MTRVARAALPWGGLLRGASGVPGFPRDLQCAPEARGGGHGGQRSLHGEGAGMTGISGEWQAVRTEAEQELEQRLSLASSEDMVRGMFFRSVREAVHALAGPEAVEDCLKDCGSGGFVDFF